MILVLDKYYDSPCMMDCISGDNAFDEDLMCKCSLDIGFKNNLEALIACNSLSVDSEPPRSSVIKNFSVNGNRLKVDFSGTQTRAIRASLNNFLDLAVLVENTIAKFGK